MASTILNVILKFMVSIVNVLMTPIDAIINRMFPNFGSLVAYWNEIVVLSFGDAFAYIVNLIPPITKQAISTYLIFLIGYYGITYTMWTITHTIDIIKRIKFW